MNLTGRKEAELSYPVRATIKPVLARPTNAVANSPPGLTQLLPGLPASFWTWTPSRPKRVCKNHDRTLLGVSAYQGMARIARKGRRVSMSRHRPRSLGETRG